MLIIMHNLISITLSVLFDILTLKFVDMSYVTQLFEPKKGCNWYLKSKKCTEHNVSEHYYVVNNS